jgi:hypothetical protein
MIIGHSKREVIAPVAYSSWIDLVWSKYTAEIQVVVPRLLADNGRIPTDHRLFRLTREFEDLMLLFLI